MENTAFEQILLSIDELKTIATISAKEALSLDEVAQVFDLKKSFLYSMVHLKKIPCYKVGGGKLTFFKKSEVEDFLLGNRVGTIEEAEAEAAAYLAKPKAKRGGRK